MDASALVVPLWPTISIAGVVLTSLIGVVVWILSVFERKQDALARNAAIENRVAILETSINSMSRDVSYIRGWLEKSGPGT